MSFNDFKKIIDILPIYIRNPLQICLVGFGEPLLYDSLFDAIAYVKEKYPRVNVTITTNGLLLDEQMGAMLITSGLSQMTISVNTINKKTYEQINRSKAYNSVVRNTKNFLLMLNEGHKSRKPITFVQILDTVNSDSEIVQFEEYWQPYLAPNAHIQIQPFVNWAGEIDPANVRLLPTAIKTDGVVDRYPCPHLFTTRNSPIVTREGLVLICCMAFLLLEEDLILGNVFETPLNDLYMGEKFRRLCDMHLKGEYNRIPACERCDAWKSHPNIWFKHPFSRHGKKWF
jgi:sulfatase maturation enzyme AslB (radical SAM superfamily)